MKRVKIQPRDNWQATLESQGMYFHTLKGVPEEQSRYWNEEVAYKFDASMIDNIETATQVLYRMCMTAVDHVISNNLMGRIGIPVDFHDMIRRSWERQDIDLYGRFDFAIDENGVPRMLEFNADTPTSLLEASAIQWYWLEDYNKANGTEYDQFNSIHENLIETFKDIGNKLIDGKDTFYFAGITDNVEDLCNLTYLQDAAIQAGLKVKQIDMSDIGWNGRSFVDLDNNVIRTIFKLYPWEWLVHEEFGKNMINEPWDIVEPAWKIVLSNKGILPILWELFPDHPNLIPAYWNSSKMGNTHVIKPIFSREGANIVIVKDGKVANNVLDMGYGEEGYVYQQYVPIPKHDGFTPVIGSWVIGGRSCGIGIREDTNEVTGNTSQFIPHYFE